SGGRSVGSSPTGGTTTAISSPATGTHTFSYDKNGNRISDGTLTTVWDRAGRMLSHDGHSYAYDGEGRRIAQTAGGSTTRGSTQGDL
ncbi:MAG: tRNA3(Ser)-specific nuclease WapA precursor, partial [Chloroflexi bacterium OLB13]